MAGASWKENTGETEKLLEIAETEKSRARRIGVKMNWKRIARKLNAIYKNDRTEKACFWCYHRARRHPANGQKVPVRTPRPMQSESKYDPVINPEEFWITATDNEGNVIHSLLVKNTAANVSRILTEAASTLNNIRDRSEDD